MSAWTARAVEAVCLLFCCDPFDIAMDRWVSLYYCFLAGKPFEYVCLTADTTEVRE